MLRQSLNFSLSPSLGLSLMWDSLLMLLLLQLLQLLLLPPLLLQTLALLPWLLPRV